MSDGQKPRRRRRTLPAIPTAAKSAPTTPQPMPRGNPGSELSPAASAKSDGGNVKLADTPRTPDSSINCPDHRSVKASPSTPAEVQLPKVDVPTPRSKKEVAEEASRKNVMAWIERQSLASPARLSLAAVKESPRPARALATSPRQPANPEWLLATGSPRAAFWARASELCQESPTTYLRVKKQLVSEFGVKMFREHRTLIQEQMLSHAVVDVPSADKEVLRDLHEFVRNECQKRTAATGPITWMHLKRELIERYGQSAVDTFKRPVQVWLKFYSTDGEADLTSPDPVDAQDTLETGSASDSGATRLARRVQLRKDLRTRLDNKNDLSEDERSLMLEQLIELDRVIVGISNEDSLSTTPSPKAPSPTDCSALVTLPDSILALVFSKLPTYTYLSVLPRVCSRFRDWVRSAPSPPLDMTWARRVLSDRVLKVKVLEQIGKVTAIDLQRCSRLTDSSCSTISRLCPDLRVLDLGGCDRITDAGIAKVVAACPDLRRWGLFNCTQVTHSAVYDIAQHQPNLEWLVVGNEDFMHSDSESTVQPLNPPTITAIATRCTRLSVLQIKAVPSALSGAGLASLLQQSRPLTTLELAHCAIPSDIGSLLSPLATTLRDVRLSDNQDLTDAAVISLTKSCPLVTALDVSGCRELTDRVIVEGLAAREQGFVRLQLARCGQLSDVGIHALAVSGSRLRHLDIAFCDHVSDTGIASLARQCPELRHLDMTCCIQLTAASVVVIGENCRRLRCLHVRGCPAMADVGLHAIAKGCPMLEQLNVWECTLVSDDGVGEILNRCPLLWSLSICGCALITDITADLIAALGSSALTDVGATDAGFTPRGKERLKKRLEENCVRSGGGKSGTVFVSSPLLSSTHF
eukprot:m.301281 g.301281  ORF g.301281 m.301281 type:complete len:866 (-) comp16305_c0_seq4:9550-12147(-)